MSSSSHCPPSPLTTHPHPPNQTKRMSLVDFATAVWNAEFSFLFIFSMICGLAMPSGIAANMAWWPISSTSWPAGHWSVTSGTCRPCTDGWDKPTDIYSNFGDSGWNYPALKLKVGLWGDWNGPALKLKAGLWGGWNDSALKLKTGLRGGWNILHESWKQDFGVVEISCTKVESRALGWLKWSCLKVEAGLWGGWNDPALKLRQGFGVVEMILP